MSDTADAALDLARRSAEALWAEDRASQGLGMRLDAVEPGRAMVSVEIKDTMVNGHGLCHGGYIFLLADTAFAFACNTQGNLAVSIENSMTYPAAIRPGEVVTATATESARSNRILYYHVHVTKADGTVVGLFRGTAYRTEKPHQI